MVSDYHSLGAHNASMITLNTMFPLELDSEIGTLANDFNRGQTFRSDTIRYVSHCLGLGDLDPRGEPTSKIIRSFKVIGDAICDAYTDGK
jgi:hypothetical protein